MPSRRAAFKAIRSDKKKRKRNEAVKSELRTRAKRLESLIVEKKDEAQKYFKTLSAKYMKAASKGVILKKTASRKISRLAKRINRIGSR